MHRRNFLKSTAIAGLGLPAAQLSAAWSENNTIQSLFGDDPFELNEITIDLLQQKMQSGELTSKKIAEKYLKRIGEMDKNGMRLNAVIEINPEALQIAQRLDDERKSGKIRGPMHGIPVLIKDNIDTGDQMKTTAGSLALADHVAEKDAFIVKKLREAGALILGKANLSEWANFRSTNSTSGWSSRGGQTKNPYIIDRNPYGSSSGSAVAVAANLCVVAIGTETDGSVVCPSSVCGIVGMKPTVGLLSRSGIIPISATQDTAGPMARTVKDLAILLGALTGIDEEDKITGESKGKAFTDYTQFLNANGLKGKRLGVDRKFKIANTTIRELYQHTLELLKKAGAEIIEIDLLDKINELSTGELELLKYEFKDGINKYLSNAKTGVRSLSDIIAFNKKHAEEILPYFGQEIFESAEQMDDITSDAYKTIYQKNHVDPKIFIDGLLKEQNLDAFCGMTSGVACATDLVYGDRWGDIYFGVPAAITGYPHITVPCGFVYDLPIGFSFFTKAYGEPELLSLAYAFEQITLQRSSPKFLQTMGA